MHEKLAISSALIAIAGSILVAAGVIAPRAELLAIVGAVIGVFGLRGWFVETQMARRRGNASDIESAIQAYKAESGQRP